MPPYPYHPFGQGVSNTMLVSNEFRTEIWAMFHRSLVSLGLLTLRPNSVSFGQAPQFKGGNRVTFIGDSITHTGTYHSHVYLFYLTRFPDHEIRIANAGISGDTARGSLKDATR